MELNLVGVILDFLKTNPVITVTSILLAISLTPLNDILIPHLYGGVVTAINGGGKGVQAQIWMIIGLLAIAQLGNLAKDYLEMYTEPRLYDFVKTRMVKAMLHKYDGDIVEPKTGQVVSKIVRSPVILSWWASSFLAYLLPQVFTLLFAFVYFLYYDWLLAFSLIFMMIGIFVLAMLAPTRCIDASVRREKELDNVHEDVEDLLRNLVSIYSNDSSDVEVNRLHETGESFVKANADAMTCLIKYKFIGVPLVILFFSLVTLRAYYLVKKGKLTAGNFVSIFTVSSTLINTLTWVVSLIKDVTEDGGVIADTHSVFNKVSNEDSLNTDKQKNPKKQVTLHLPDIMTPHRMGIGFYRVTYAHKDSQRPLIQNTSIHFEHLQRTVIVGEIGKGKTTALKLIMAFIRPRSGDLYIDGEWYSNLKPKEVRSMVAYMPQECVLFNRTIAANILYGAAEGKTIADVKRMMQSFGVLKEFQDMPNGLMTMAGKNGMRLSGGQRQLVWLMRILIRNPAYIILDEPTTSMDSHTKGILLKILKHASTSSTLIMVTHDEDLMALATRVVTWE